MVFFSREQKPSGVPLLPYQIPGGFYSLSQFCSCILKAAGWNRRCTEIPFGMLYHQNHECGAFPWEVSYSQLEQRLLGMSCFLHVSPKDFQCLISHLLELDHLQETEEQGFIIGLEGGKIIGNHHFLAVFPEGDEYTVNTESRQIGKIEVPPPIGERITLAGRNWEVLGIDLKRKNGFCERIRGKINTFWQGEASISITRWFAKMRQIITGDTQYPYLKGGAASRLAETRNLAGKAGFDRKQIFSLGGNTVLLLPWLGTVDYHVFMALIRHFLKERFDLKSLGGQAPYFIIARLGNGDINEFTEAIRGIFENSLDLLEIFSPDELDELKRNIEYRTPKFDEFIPKALLWKSLVHDYVHIDSIREAILGMV